MQGWQVGGKHPRDTRPLWGSQFFQSHAVFVKIWQNRLLTPPEGWRPHLGEILEPPLHPTGMLSCLYLMQFIICMYFLLKILQNGMLALPPQGEYRIDH